MKGLCIAILLLSSYCYGQNNDFGKVWVLGGGVSYTVKFGVNNVSTAFLDTFYSPYFTEGGTNICDSVGNLILCSDGYNIYDKNADVLDGGDTIVPKEIYIWYDGWSSYSQSSIFLPKGNDEYYFITPTASDSEVINHWKQPATGLAYFDLLLYNVVDMKANGGKGAVTKRMIPLLQDVPLSKTQMMACRHGDGKSWWLLKQASEVNTVYKFLFTSDSIAGPFIQSFPEPNFTKWDLNGQSAFSADGTKYATTCRGAHQIFVADFDRCSGELTNPQVYPVPVGSAINPNDSTHPVADPFSEGLAFSPNGRFIYVSQYFNIQQLDLLAADSQSRWVRVAGMDTTWHWFQQYSAIYPGPDGRIYIGNWSGLGGEMSVINQPNRKGLDCGFCPKCLRFPTFYSNGDSSRFGASTPPCMPNYKLGAATPPCGGIDTPQQQPFGIYPNPSDGYFTISYPEGGAFVLADVLGRVVYRSELPAAANSSIIDVRYLSAGVYVYRYNTEQHNESGKIIIR